MHLVSKIGYMAFLIACFYGITAAIGAEFLARILDFMFADYIALWDEYFADSMPAWTHPVVIVILVALLATMIPSLLRITCSIAAFIVALFLVRIGFMSLGIQAAPEATLAMMLYAIFATGWLLFASALGERSLWVWLRRSQS